MWVVVMGRAKRALPSFRRRIVALLGAAMSLQQLGVKVGIFGFQMCSDKQIIWALGRIVLNRDAWY